MVSCLPELPVSGGVGLLPAVGEVDGHEQALHGVPGGEVPGLVIEGVTWFGRILGEVEHALVAVYILVQPFPRMEEMPYPRDGGLDVVVGLGELEVPEGVVPVPERKPVSVVPSFLVFFRDGGEGAGAPKTYRLYEFPVPAPPEVGLDGEPEVGVVAVEFVELLGVADESLEVRVIEEKVPLDPLLELSSRLLLPVPLDVNFLVHHVF